MQLFGTIGTLLTHKGNQIYSIAPEATVYEALEKMAGKNVGSLLVLREGQVLGILSERDYSRKVILKGKNSRETRVDEIMRVPVVSVSPGQSVDECMRLMTEHKVRHLPVIEGNNLLGVISIGDLVNSIITTQTAAIQQLESYIAGTYSG